MKKLFVFSVMCFLTLLPNVSKSCLVPAVSDEQRINDAKIIFVGRVTSINYGKDEATQALSRKDIEAHGLGAYYTYRINTTKTLKGRSKKALSAPICYCGCGDASLNDTVVVFKYSDGSFYVSNNKDMIASVEKILGK